jgi:hypothetical protein
MCLAEYDVYIFPLLAGITIAVVTQIVSYLLSKKNLDAQREHSLKLARMQLYHEDRKEALVKLDELLKKTYKTYSEFRDAVNAFLDGSSAIFLNDKLRKDLKKELYDIDAFLTEKELEFFGPPPEQDEQDYGDWFESLSPDQQIDVEVENRLTSLKGTMRDRIKKHVSEE